MFKQAYNWVVFSSADSSKLSASLKGIGGFIVIAAAWSQFGDVINQALVDELTQSLVAVVVKGGEFATALYGAYGVGRKIYFLVRPAIS